MTHLLLRNLFSLLLIVCLTSCKNKSFVGYWKVDHLTYIKGTIEDPIPINDKDSLFLILQKVWGQHYNAKQIDSIVYQIQHTYLTLNSDKTFKLVDAGSLIRDPEGFFKRGVAEGKWEYSKKYKILKLDFSPEISRRYKILNLKDSSIILNELFEETNEPVTKVRLIRK